MNKVIRHQIVPLTLFRIGNKKPKLRDYEIQIAKGSRSYDLKLDENGLVLPAVGDKFIGPNGIKIVMILFSTQISCCYLLFNLINKGCH